MPSVARTVVRLPSWERRCVHCCRVSQIALVSKTWQEIEREHPLRPEQLRSDPEDCSASLMAWHLRDTNSLREVFVVEPMAKYSVISARSYGEWTSKLLHHLSVSASNLRSLSLTLPKHHHYCGCMAVVLPLIGALIQLKSLVLSNGWDTKADIHAISHLTRLQRLEVTLANHQVGLPSHHIAPQFSFVLELYSQDSHAISRCLTQERHVTSCQAWFVSCFNTAGPGMYVLQKP